MPFDIVRHIFGPAETFEEKVNYAAKGHRCYNLTFYEHGFALKPSASENCGCCEFLKKSIAPYCQLSARGVVLEAPNSDSPYLIIKTPIEIKADRQLKIQA
jgi:hypothetical protein